MMRSLFSGVTGLRTHQTKMDVIGNNISNVNTEGFKRSSTTFADLYSETVSPSSGSSAATGGINAKQIGLGAQMNSIVMSFSPGAASYTGKPLDLAIPGDGFFVLRTPDGYRFTRNGSLEVAGNGTLQTVSGNYAVQCYSSTYKAGDAGKAVANGLTGSTTSFGSFNMDTTSANAVDVKATPAGSYTFSMDATGKVTTYKNGLTFGAAVDITKADGTPLNTTGNVFETGQTYSFISPGVGRIEFKATKDIAVGNIADGIKEIQGIINNASIEISNNDGFVAGNQLGDLIIDSDLYSNISINENGAVIAMLKSEMTPTSNGQPIAGAGTMAQGERVILGYVSLATFTNQEGLEKIGTNLYQISPNSGRAQFHLPGDQGVSKLSPSSLEMSNVDLSQEMVNMITTQRGFQANSRIITTSDSMLEELVNLKR